MGFLLHCMPHSLTILVQEKYPVLHNGKKMEINFNHIIEDVSLE